MPPVGKGYVQEPFRVLSLRAALVEPRRTGEHWQRHRDSSVQNPLSIKGTTHSLSADNHVADALLASWPWVNGSEYDQPRLAQGPRTRADDRFTRQNPTTASDQVSIVKTSVLVI